MFIQKILVLLAGLCAAVAGIFLVLEGEMTQGIMALCYSTLECIYYEIRWGSD